MIIGNEEIIRTHLIGEYEVSFFSACLGNLYDEKNPLRFNNFAYSMRELLRNVLNRMAPAEEVKKAIWYRPDKNVDKPTRIQLMKYAVQGWLSDETMHEKLRVDIEAVLNELRESIDELSKYTHINESTFNVDKKDVVSMSGDIMEKVANWLQLIDETRNAVHEAVYECVDNDMIQQFYQTTNPELDLLSTHHEIENYWVDEIEKDDDNAGNIHVTVKGSVDVRLQYGSDGDLKRDIGWETYNNYPFTSQINVSYKNQYGDIRIINEGVYAIDVDSYYE